MDGVKHRLTNLFVYFPLVLITDIFVDVVLFQVFATWLLFICNLSIIYIFVLHIFPTLIIKLKGTKINVSGSMKDKANNIK